MGRGHWHPTYCRECGTTREQAGRISQTGKCEDCGRAALNDAHEQLRAHSGDTFERWRRGMALCVGAVAPASPSTQPQPATD
jgi:hypothetical protein